MPDLLTPISDICQTQLETSRRFADAVFSGTGKIDRIWLTAAHRALDEQLRYAQAVGNTRDLQVLGNLQATFWSAKPEQIQDFQQELVRTFTEMQNELGRATQAFIEQFGVNSMRFMPTALSSATPAFSSRAAAADPLAPMMSAWNSAMQGVAQLSGQTMSSMRQAARSVTSSMEETVKAAGAQSASRRTTGSRDENGNGNGNGNGSAAAETDSHGGGLQSSGANGNGSTTGRPSRRDADTGHPTRNVQADGNGQGNGNDHGNGHGNGHAQRSHMSRLDDQQAHLAEEHPESKPESRISDDPEKESPESGDGSAGGRKSVQNRKK